MVSPWTRNMQALGAGASDGFLRETTTLTSTASGRPAWCYAAPVGASWEVEDSSANFATRGREYPPAAEEKEGWPAEQSGWPQLRDQSRG